MDGYIAGPEGEIDWIIMDSAIDFAGLMDQFDTVLMGRRTFEHMLTAGRGVMPGMATLVASNTLQPNAHPGVSILSRDIEKRLRSAKATSGKDIWLFGGGHLASSLMDARLVDSIEVMVMPVLLGEGTPLFRGSMKKLVLKDQQTYESGIVSMKYECSNVIRQSP